MQLSPIADDIAIQDLLQKAVLARKILRGDLTDVRNADIVRYTEQEKFFNM